MEKKTIGLQDVLTNYGVPDPKIVGKLPKGGIQLDFVGHADVTKMLIEIDPMWSWEPVAFDADGLPAYRVENGMAHMAGWLTVHGVRRLGVGSVAHNKADLLKELCSDFIRNAAMRFGVCLSLWTKQEWDDIPSHTPAPAPKAATKPAPKTPSQFETTVDGKCGKCRGTGIVPGEPYEDEKGYLYNPGNQPCPVCKTPKQDKKLSDEKREQFFESCKTKKVDPQDVIKIAGIKDINNIMESDLPRLRVVFKELQNSAK